MLDYLLALEHYHQAEQNFALADPAYIDVAVYELKAAEIKLSALLREQKNKGEIA